MISNNLEEDKLEDEIDKDSKKRKKIDKGQNDEK